MLKMKNLKRKSDERIEERIMADPDNVQPLSFDEQYDLVKDSFGERKGTSVRGMGGAVKGAAKKRGGPRTVLTQEAEEGRQELEERARQAEANAHEAKEAAARAEEQAKTSREESQLMREESQLMRERIQALEAMMQNVMTAQAN